MAGKKVFYILGNSGFVGSAIEKFLISKKLNVVGINRENYNKYKGAQCDIFINANGSSKKRLAEEDPQQDFELNVASTLKTVFDFKFYKYIFISTVDVYNDLSNPKNNSEEVKIDEWKLSNYGFDKLLAEKIIQKYCKNWLIFRLGGMVGEGLKKNAIYDLLNIKSLFVNPDSEYQYINTQDVARIIFELKSRKNEIYNICGDEAVKLSKVAEYLKIKLDKKLYSLPKQVYNINAVKIKKMTTIPKTEDTIKRFINCYKTKA